MTAIIAILATTVGPMLFTAWLINRICEHRLRMRQLPTAQALTAAHQQQMRALTSARGDLEQRIQNLEAIVTSTDYEVDRRLRQTG